MEAVQLQRAVHDLGRKVLQVRCLALRQADGPQLLQAGLKQARWLREVVVSGAAPRGRRREEREEPRENGLGRVPGQLLVDDRPAERLKMPVDRPLDPPLVTA